MAGYLRQQAVVFMLHNRVTLTGAFLQAGTIEYPDVTSRITDQPRLLQIERRLGHAFAAYTQHIGHQFLGHDQFVPCKPVQAEQ